MKTENIKKILLNFLNELKERIKDMAGLPYFKRYVILAVLLTVFFTFLTFPFESAVKSKLAGLEGKILKTVNIESLDLNLLGSSSAEGVEICFRDDSRLAIKSLIGNFSFLKMVSDQYKGNLDLEKISWSRDSIKADGDLSADIDLTLDRKTGLPSDGTLKLILAGIRIASENFEIPGGMGFILPELVKISSVNLNSVIKDKTVSIKQLKISGDLNGDITGSIETAPVLGNSVLNLKIFIDPESPVLSDFRTMLIQFTDESDRIHINVSGTAARPKTDIVKKKKSQQ